MVTTWGLISHYGGRVMAVADEYMSPHTQTHPHISLATFLLLLSKWQPMNWAGEMLNILTLYRGFLLPELPGKYMLVQGACGSAAARSPLKHVVRPVMNSLHKREFPVPTASSTLCLCVCVRKSERALN